MEGGFTSNTWNNIISPLQKTQEIVKDPLSQEMHKIYQFRSIYYDILMLDVNIFFPGNTYVINLLVIKLAEFIAIELQHYLCTRPLHMKLISILAIIVKGLLLLILYTH